ncbi:MAG TPA: hydrogenase maturation protease, partial [Actinomycetota bacterium]
MRDPLPPAGDRADLKPRVRVIGCGTLDAGDDAVGLLAVREARERLEAIAGVEVLEAAALDVVHLLEDVDGAVVVDAVRAPSGLREPGTIVRAEAGPDGLPADVRSSLSSHGLGLAEAVGLAAALGGMPRVVFLGIEVADVTAG